MRTTICRGLTTAMLVLSMSGVSSLAVADPIEIAQAGGSSGTGKTLIAVYVAYTKGERRQKIDIHTEIDCSISAFFGGLGLPIAPCVAKEGNLEIDLNTRELERDQRTKMMSRCKSIMQSCSGRIVGTTGTSDGKMIINVSELKLD